MTTPENTTAPGIDQAYFAASANFEAVIKDATNPHFGSKFASLKSVLKAVGPALRSNDLLLRQSTTTVENRQVLWTTLTHVPSGETWKSSWELHPVKADPQGEGSALTYARRYAILTMMGLVPEDDDGNDASTNNSRERAEQEAKAEALAAERQAAKDVAVWVQRLNDADTREKVRAVGNGANVARVLDLLIDPENGDMTLRDAVAAKLATFPVPDNDAPAEGSGA